MNTRKHMSVFSVGKVSITRIEETYLPVYRPGDIFPEYDAAIAAEHADWMAPHPSAAEKDLIKLSVHSWLVQIGAKKILIDCCCGNNRRRPARPFWDMLNTPYLDRLAAAGARPQDIDYVMCTHLHHDHVGWNTKLRDGTWVPTLATARCSSATCSIICCRSTTRTGISRRTPMPNRRARAAAWCLNLPHRRARWCCRAMSACRSPGISRR